MMDTTAWMQDDSMDGGGREGLEHILEVERRRRPKPRIKLNITYRHVFIFKKSIA